MKILILGAEPGYGQHLKKSLSLDGFVVDCSLDYAFCDKVLQQKVYDLVILADNSLSQIGLETCSTIRSAGHDLPLLAISATPSLQIKIDFFNAGADDHLAWPLSTEELKVRVRSLLRRSRLPMSEILNVGDLEIDIRKQLVLKKGRQIYLTRKEFLLLEYLARNPGAVLSRAMIMGHVWDVNADLFSNTIETHVLNLRKKLDLKSKDCSIVTVPGRGYKLEVK